MAELLVLLIVVALIVGGVALYRRYAIQQRQAAERAALETQLSTSKRAADEDVTKFGEELQRLDSDVAGHALDEAMQQDYQRALDAYDNSKMSLDAVTKPEEIRHVTEILEDGRYAVACVKARIAGEPLRPSVHLASSIPRTAPPHKTSHGHLPEACRDRCQPAPPTRNGCLPEPIPTSAPCRSAPSACLTGKAARRTRRGRRVTTAAGAAATCFPAC